MSVIEEGAIAPQFTLNDENGTAVNLSDYAGKWVVVYFYPKDDTPGCVKEANKFKSLHHDFSESDTVILGVSPDDALSHTSFIEKYNLPFKLLSDPDKKVMEKWGAWGEKNMYGKISVGVIRSTVLIAPDGIVAKHWKRVSSAEKHPDHVLKFISEKSA